MSAFQRILVANRGEIAIRVMRAAAGLSIESVAVHTPDDAASLHAARADHVLELPGAGVAGYLDVDAIIAAAKTSGADAIHPGYGFLAENAGAARAITAAGLTFIGPSPDLLELFGDKVAARAAATEAGLTVPAGSLGPATVDEAAELLAAHGSIMIKAVAGGGGRGMRAVRSADELQAAWDRCASEATSAFGDGALYVEQLIEGARHIEVQILGDGSGQVVHLGERDCSLQRRNQKVLELAPAPDLPSDARDRICSAAVALGAAVSYRTIATVEFLVDAADPDRFWFIETNARVQVEHTITEEVTGVDLVETQIALAAGADLASLGLADAPASRGWAIQARINAETIDPTGLTRPSAGTVSIFEPASGPGVRVDTAGYSGMTLNPNFDSLLAKLVVHRGAGSFDEAASKLRASLAESRVVGAATNIGFLQALAADPRFGSATTTWIEENLESITTAAATFAGSSAGAASPMGAGHVGSGPATAGALLGSDDPLAVLDFGRVAGADGGSESGAAAGGASGDELADGLAGARTPLQGTIVSIEVEPGQTVVQGQLVAVVEAMKMEHEIPAPASGTVERVAAGVGDTLWPDQLVLVIAESDVGDGATLVEEVVDLDEIRPSLAEVLALRERMMDEARPAAVERRRKTGQRTARENLADLVDDGTFVEYGPMALAAQRRRRTWDDLVDRSPADGLITGVGSVNGERFEDPTNRCAVMIYDYTVFAGTQGIRNHAKTDRIIDVATDGRMPFILYAEGGGGRPGDTDGGDFGSRTFSRFATMSGLVPMVGVVSGYCFAGNASLLGCCDVIIATKNTNIGMGGPAMIEGGGLGVFRPDEIGPAEVHTENGVIDILVEDEAEATEIAKKYLAYFQGPTEDWEANDQRLLRRAIPENRLRTYDVRELIENLADVDSVLELREDFGHGMVTSLIRVEGKPLGLIANNPNHLGGAIDSDGADKGRTFHAVVRRVRRASSVPL